MAIQPLRGPSLEGTLSLKGTLVSINPATGELLATFDELTPQQVDEAIADASLKGALTTRGQAGRAPLP
jgi:acyl-CoA reductase-like NAD-dependent aldehyde dehydrogenase